MTSPSVDKVLVVTVRGSTESQGGSHFLGPLAEAVTVGSTLPCRRHELVYPATFETFESTYPTTFDLGDSPAIGVVNLLSLLHSSAAEHPSQRVVLLGWSQGAQVITDTLLTPNERLSGRSEPALAPEAADRVAAVALFGNPRFYSRTSHAAGTYLPGVDGTSPQPPHALAAYTDRLRDYCAAGDIACQHAPGSTVEGHVSYFTNGMRETAAAFVLRCLSDAGASVPERPA